MCEKFHYDRLRNDGSLGMENLIRRRTRTRTTFRSAWRPVSGSKKNAGSDDDVRIWLTGEPSLKLLTEESVCDVVISFSSGRVFQIRAGPATVNARSPTVERLTDGTIRRLVQPERNVRRPGRSATRSGPRYRGALPCKTLYVSTRPVESHIGARENIIAGPYHTPHSVCIEIETPKASRGSKRGEGGNVGRVVPSPSH